MKKATWRQNITPERVLLVLMTLLLILSGAYLYSQQKQINELVSNTGDLNIKQSETESTLAQANETISSLKSEIEELTEEYEDLEEEYDEERDKNEDFEDQIRGINKTVGVLDKLAKTDEELLQKYSIVNFLNEHYVPESLKEIDDKWKYDESRSHQLHGKVLPYLEDMLTDALDDGVELWVVSAYRSFDFQAQLKGQYLVTYGSGANAFSADQGFSEHQLGTTVDFTTSGLGGGLDGFGETAAYDWLLKNAHKYGFVLSYPPNNQFYVFEPWHWRFVGEDLADDLHDDDAYFYDWDQRKIDEYLIDVFD